MSNAKDKNVLRPEQERDSLTIRLNMQSAMNAIADIRELCDIMDEQGISTLNLRFVDNAEVKAVTFLKTFADELRHKIGLHSLERRRAENSKMIKDVSADMASQIAADNGKSQKPAAAPKKKRKTS